MITAEVGKTVEAALEEAFEYAGPSWGKAAEEILRYRGMLLPSTQENTTNKRLVLGHRPLGPIGVITPYNFPTDICVYRARPRGSGRQYRCLEANRVCAGIPARWSPKCSPRQACPPGVINVVQGLGDTGAAIVDSDDIKGIFFTGSTATGEKIAQRQSVATRCCWSSAVTDR